MEQKGQLFYDGDCAFCVRLAQKFAPLLNSRGFVLRPFPSCPARANSTDVSLPARMRLRTDQGEVYEGAAALFFLAERIWWSRPVHLLGQSRLVRRMAQAGYDWVARNRYCFGARCAHTAASAGRGKRALDWAPLVLLTAGALGVGWNAPRWVLMWLLAGAIFLGCKWLAWRTAEREIKMAGWPRLIAYFLLWPGLDARAFLDRTRRPAKPPVERWVFAVGSIVLGAILFWGIARFAAAPSPLLAGWLGMIGIAFLLHFGLFHLLALAWMTAGVCAEPIMRAPIAARSLSDFWSRRWNRAFNDWAVPCVFRPLLGRFGKGAAVLGTFLVSGLLHELVISVPAGAGYGLPATYFLLQGMGVAAESSAVGRHLQLDRVPAGRLFALVMAAGPVFWLFHPPFVYRVFLPFMKTMGGL